MTFKENYKLLFTSTNAEFCSRIQGKIKDEGCWFWLYKLLIKLVGLRRWHRCESHCSIGVNGIDKTKIYLLWDTQDYQQFWKDSWKRWIRNCLSWWHRQDSSGHQDAFAVSSSRVSTISCRGMLAKNTDA